MTSPCRLTLILSCPMDLKNFPMDVQTCTMQLESCKHWIFSTFVTALSEVSVDGISNFLTHLFFSVSSWLHHEWLDLRVAGEWCSAGVRWAHTATVHYEGREGAGLLYKTLQHWSEETHNQYTFYTHCFCWFSSWIDLLFFFFFFAAEQVNSPV